MIRIKRAYEAADSSDGFRVLVDRLWPRGVTKARARIELWLKDVAPSDQLRKWFGHEPERWPEFQRRYAAELKAHREALDELRTLAREHGTLTLVFAAKDEQRNDAVVLRTLLSPAARQSRRTAAPRRGRTRGARAGSRARRPLAARPRRT